MEEKYLAYKKLMQRKRLVLLTPVVIMVLFLIAHELFNLPFFLLFLIIPIYLYISQYTLLAVNNCPWCGLPFFFFGKYSIFLRNSIHFFVQNKCINCNRLHQADLPDL